MKQLLRVLMVEDSENDAALLLAELRRGGFEVVHVRVQTADAMREALDERTWDVVVSDYSLPQFSGIGALAVLKATGLDVPLIVASGTIGEETAVEALRAGACDFLLKDRLARLTPAIEREIREAASRRARRELALAFAESKERMQFALAAAGVGIWESDLASGSTTWSDVLEQLHGLPIGAFGNTFDAFVECIHPDDRRAVLGSIAQSTRDRSDSRVEYRTSWPNGSIHWIARIGRTFYAPSGAPIRAAGVGIDVTAQKHLEATAARELAELQRFEHTLQQKNRELEDASRVKSEFLATMSHELRTPLNAIIGFSEILKDGLIGEMTEKQQGFVGDIFSSGTHLLALVNDILDLSKVETGKMTLDLESMDVSLVLADSFAVIREKAAARRIRLEIDAAEALGVVQADSRKVKQMLHNLLINAVTFANEGGHVTLRARRVPSPEVGRRSSAWTDRSFPLSDNAFTEFLQVSVIDDGMGISPEGLAQLFVPFSQIESGLARRFEGAGLGLAIVKRLAELHGGTVAVESALGEGSCFTVWLPTRG